MDNIIEKKPSKIVISISVLLIIIKSYLAYIKSRGEIGYVIGFVFTLPFVIIFLSSIFKVYRNWNSRWIIVLNTMLVIFLTNLGNLLPSV